MISVLDNKVAVKPLYDPDVIGHIIIPDQAKERCDQGIVKAIGARVKEICPELELGMHILFSGYDGSLIELEDEGLFLVMPVEFVRAIIFPPNIGDIPGLYFKDKDGETWTATYEQAQELIARAVESSEWGKIAMGKNYLMKKKAGKGGY